MDELAFSLSKNKQLFSNPRQAHIYLTLLRSGAMGAERLSKETKLHRETIQRELKKMEGKGVVKITRAGRNRRAEAIPIAALQEALERSKENFDSILKPLLEVEAAKNEPQVQIVSNDHSFALLQIKLLKLQPERETIYVLSTQPKAWREAMTGSRKLNAFEKLRIEKEIGFQLSCFSDYRGEVEYNNREYFAGQPATLKRKYRYVETEESSPLQIQIWQNAVLISMFKISPSMHILIENKDVRKAMRAYFDVLWSVGK